MTQVEALAKYAVRASFADLSVQSRKQLPVHILDSLGCCIAALGAGPIEACRAQVSDFGGDGPCALIGGGNANPIFAAFWHTVLVRYVDFMDNFLAPTETCHCQDARPPDSRQVARPRRPKQGIRAYSLVCEYPQVWGCPSEREVVADRAMERLSFVWWCRRYDLGLDCPILRKRH
jgi:MmgE/PrpD N-terminal domain